jgi:hypothetical protein
MPYLFRSKLDASIANHPVKQLILLVDFDYRVSCIVLGVKMFNTQQINSYVTANFML